MYWLREKFGTVIVLGIVVFVGFVFVFAGVFTPEFGGGAGGNVVGSVNGEAITLSEFNRELNRRLEFFKGLGGGNITEEQMRAFRIREGVFGELVNRKLMIQAAKESGMVASDEEVRKQIRDIPAFQKDGKFDSQLYRQVLQANNYSPAQFENLVREDLSLQKWGKFFKDRVHVSEEEIKDEFLVSQDKRDIKYVMITPEEIRKNVKVEPAEVRKYLADEKNMNLVKSRYEADKDDQYKGKSLDQAKDEIARELLASEKTEQVKKLTDQLAAQVAANMSASKATDAKVKSLLKPYGLEVKNTGPLTQKTQYLPGVGEAKELMNDAFAEKSPISPAAGGKAKSYTLPSGTLVAVVTDVERPKLSQLDEKKSEIRTQLASQKERELFEAWLKKLSDKADIERNKDVVGEA